MSPLQNLGSLIDDISTDTTRVRVVIINELPGAGIERVFETYHLELADRLQARFRRNVARMLRTWPETAEWTTHDPGYVPDEGEISRASRELVADSQLPAAIDRGLQPDHIRMPAAAEPATPGVHGYAVVFVPAHAPRAIVVRRLDPVERLGRGRISAFVHENQLTDSDQTLAFDSGVDVLLLHDEVIVRHLAALEAMFFPASVRAAAAVSVVRELGARVEIANLGDLEEVARNDSIFGGRLRRFAKSDALATASIPRIRASLRAFGWESRFIVDDQLRFDASGRWRWPFLAALEDGLTESPGSGRLYRSNSQQHIPRRLVTSVGRSADGVVAQLCGEDWGPIDAASAADQIEHAVASYYLGTREAPIEVLPDAAGQAGSISAVDEHGRDQLSGLPDCRRG